MFGCGLVAHAPTPRSLCAIQASKRASRKLGFGLQNLGSVSSDMQPEGKVLVELTSAFGAAVEALVIKHGKGITEQQSQLGRY
jgi:hypothetical protein